jgi:hypothetical protein
MTNICLLHHCSFFLRRSNKLATDIDSLAPGLDRHVVRLGIGRKGIRKSGETLATCFQAHSLFYCRICNHCTAKQHSSLAHSLWTLELPLLSSLDTSPLLHSLGHDTRLVIPSPVLCCKYLRSVPSLSHEILT